MVLYSLWLFDCTHSPQWVHVCFMWFISDRFALGGFCTGAHAPLVLCTDNAVESLHFSALSSSPLLLEAALLMLLQTTSSFGFTLGISLLKIFFFGRLLVCSRLPHICCFGFVGGWWFFFFPHWQEDENLYFRTCIGFVRLNSWSYKSLFSLWF